MITLRGILLGTLVLFLANVIAVAEDWPQWRGPTGDNHAAEGAVAPTVWTDSTGLAWETPIPGRGHSSPILVGERIYLTTADDDQQTQSLLIVDQQSGALVAEKVVHRGGFPEEIYPTNTHASSTVASDGVRVFTLFMNDNASWLTCFDLSGEQLWQRRLAEFAPEEFKFGSGTTPIVFDGLVIVANEYDGPDSCLVALDAKSGEERWRTARPQNLSYSTPAIARLESGATLFLSGNDFVAAYDPVDGKELWKTEATTQITCGTMVWDEQLEMVFASGGYSKSETVAVSLAEGHDVVWDNGKKCYEQSMLVVDGYVYAVANNGIAFCWRGEDGEQMWKQRLGGRYSSSPLLVGQHIHVTNETGTTFVFRANPEEYELISKNQLGTACFATPAPSDGRLYHRFVRGDGDAKQEFIAAIGPAFESD